MYLLGERLSMENTDGVKMTGQIIHVTVVNGKVYYIVQYESGLQVSHSREELDELVVFSW